MIDEAHLNSGPNTRLVKTILTFKMVRKRFLTGTSFGSGSKRLVRRISDYPVSLHAIRDEKARKLGRSVTHVVYFCPLLELLG